MPLSHHEQERNMKKFQVLAHRGLVSEFVPENTIKAFADALHAGADVIETDVQCTSDGIPIIFHDEDLLRLAGIPKKVSETSWKEISVIDIGFGKRIPTLEQVLEDFPGARLNLDIKSANAIKPTAALINRLEAHQRVLISSFSEARRKQTVSLLAAPVRTSAGSSRVLTLWILAALGLAPLFKLAARGITALQLPVSRFPIRLDGKRFIKLALGSGLELHYWTINDVETVQRLHKLGATGVVTDYCDKIISSLEKDI
jgi:glycerophosphoryl diester phosphodiesterase